MFWDKSDKFDSLWKISLWGKVIKTIVAAIMVKTVILMNVHRINDYSMNNNDNDNSEDDLHRCQRWGKFEWINK